MKTSRLSPYLGWSLILTVFVVAGFRLGAVGHAPSRSSDGSSPYDDGEKIYMSRCMSCHQQNGMGIPGVFPPLAGSEWAVGDEGRLVRIVLLGVTGEFEVGGVTYSGAMPPWNTFLTDQEIADVLTYVRGAWGNEAGPITTDQVAAVREVTKDRNASWNQAELEQAENQGIPGAPSNMFTPPDSTGNDR